MLTDNPYVLAALLAIALGYFTVEKVKAPVKKAAHSICHVVTFGKRCANPPAVKP